MNGNEKWTCQWCDVEHPADVDFCATCEPDNATPLSRLQKLEQLDREGLGPALDMMLDLFVGHGLHKTGEPVEQRWRKLNYWEIHSKASRHLANARTLDRDSSLPHVAHSVMRALMCLELEIEAEERRNM